MRSSITVTWKESKHMRPESSAIPPLSLHSLDTQGACLTRPRPRTPIEFKALTQRLQRQRQSRAPQRVTSARCSRLDERTKPKSGNSIRENQKASISPPSLDKVPAFEWKLLPSWDSLIESYLATKDGITVVDEKPRDPFPEGPDRIAKIEEAIESARSNRAWWALHREMFSRLTGKRLGQEMDDIATLLCKTDERVDKISLSSSELFYV